MTSHEALAELIGRMESRQPAGPPCLDPWCGNTRNPCGHTPNAHMEHHGARAIIAGQADGKCRNPLCGGDGGQCPTCELDVRPPLPAAVDDTPPPSTVAEMRTALKDYDDNRPRSMQTTLGPSELGTPCQRQMAYKLSGATRQVINAPKWAAMQGTAMHALMEDVLGFHNGQLGRPRWVIEQRVDVDDEIGGAGDAYDADHALVVDWKYVGVTTLRKVRRKTVPVEQLVTPDYRVQAHLYGYGHERAGRPVRWVRLVLLARSHDYDDSAEWTERYRPEIAIAALDRYYATQDLVAALGLPDSGLFGAVPATPGDACQWCEFRRPGGTADATGCPGNTDEKIDKQVRGLIA